MCFIHAWTPCFAPIVCCCYCHTRYGPPSISMDLIDLHHSISFGCGSRPSCLFLLLSTSVFLGFITLHALPPCALPIDFKYMSLLLSVLYCVFYVVLMLNTPNKSLLAFLGSHVTLIFNYFSC